MDHYLQLSTYLQPGGIELKKPTPFRPSPGIPLPIMPMTPPPPPAPPAPITDLESDLLDQLITKQINDNLAFSYIRHVETTCSPQIYNEFIDTMKLYKLKKISFDYLRDKINRLFNNHSDLIIGFNTFLPEPYKISMENRKIQEYQLLPGVDPTASAHYSGFFLDHHSNDHLRVPSLPYPSPDNSYNYKKLHIQHQNSIVQSRFHPYAHSQNNINSAFIDPRYETISPDQSSAFY